ncbi:MAG: Acetyltransferase family [Alphaproteobacteria bacterium]|nr:Acetyltransferase family [Alphaproteobacteria bacterium]
MRENIALHQGACIIALDDHNNAIGFITGWLEGGDGLDSGNYHSGGISDVFVLLNWRGQGVFTAMLAEMAAHFRAQGMTRMETYTLGMNRAMQDILARSGFAPHKVYYEISLNAP